MNEFDAIINKVISQFKQDAALAAVKNYYVTNGILPGPAPCISVGFDGANLQEYDNVQDKATARFKVYVYTTLSNIERGEAYVREIAMNARLCLVQNRDIHITKMTPVYAEGENALHCMVIDFETDVFLPRRMPDREITYTIVRGTTDTDPLPIAPVTGIVRIPGYMLGVDYQQNGDGVQWLPTGKQPTAGVAYSVTWRFDETAAKVNKLLLTVNDETVNEGGA